jgi:hypothetical protein
MICFNHTGIQGGQKTTKSGDQDVISFQGNDMVSGAASYNITLENSRQKCR